MAAPQRKVRLQGFNNLTKVVSFNLYDFFVARTEAERMAYIKYIDSEFSAKRITDTLENIAKIIDAEVLSVSKQDYEPHGASSLVLMSDLGQDGVTEDDVAAAQRACRSVGAHLTKSHLCAHTYPDWLDPRGICSFRVDIDIATCGTIVPLRALDYMFESFENDLVIIDYVVRGYTRDTDGNRVYMDHKVSSIRDYINPDILDQYDCEDLVLQNENIWQLKMKRSDLDPNDYFDTGTDTSTERNVQALEDVEREMAGIFYGWPS